MTVAPFPVQAQLDFKTQADTDRFADLLAKEAKPGLTVLLDGQVGAGKTTIARRTIQTLLQAAGHLEDVPSPTFTIVQSYETPNLEIWHADLYRLSSTAELSELGLEAAFETAFCIVEWPDRLGEMGPLALRVGLAFDPENETARTATLSADAALADVMSRICEAYSR